MSPEKRNQALLYDMLHAAVAARGFVVARTFVEYEADLLLRSAVERQVEIIGEAARGVSTGFKTDHPEIPWRRIMAQRHVLAHEYGDIKNDRIWNVATVDLPELIRHLEPLVPVPPSTEGLE